MVLSFFRVVSKVDYVLIDTYSTNAFYYAWAIAQLARLFGKPYIPLLHGGRLPERLARSPWLCRMVFGFAFVNAAPSTYLMDVFQKAGFRVTFIPNFINIGQYPFLLRKQLRPRLLWVRSFHRQYHPELAVKVLAKLLETYPQASLCMVGPNKDGSLEKCKALAETMGIAGQIRFTGLMPKSEWITLSNDSDLFINTTNFDNMPVSVIEAMALGLPVVSTNVGGLPYLIKDREDGLLVDKGNVTEMVDAIRRLLEEPALASRLSSTARAKAENFDAGIVLQKWVALLSG